MLPVLLACGAVYSAEPAISKAACDATLTSEITRMEEGFSRARLAWQESVEQRFADHDELSASQMQAARSKFDALVLSQSSEHVKAVALPGLYRMMLTIPQYDLSVCSDPKEVRSLGDQAIAGFLMRLTELFPLVETSVDAAVEGG
jgi:vacuolar-type H+-ATPase subunit D/Vma8